MIGTLSLNSLKLKFGYIKLKRNTYTGILAEKMHQNQYVLRTFFGGGGHTIYFNIC